MSNQPVTAALAETTAEVRAGDVTTRYRRTGSGRPVIVLGASDETDPAASALADLLSTRFRVIVPDLPVAGVDIAAWLQDFVEALGIERVAVVVPERFGVAALDLALLDGE